MMISPATYAQVVLPADRHYRRQIARFGLHHCGQMDRYLEAYQTLKPIEFIEVGWGSSVAAVRAAFPDAKLDLMIHIFDLQNLPGSQVRKLMLKIVREATPYRTYAMSGWPTLGRKCPMKAFWNLSRRWIGPRPEATRQARPRFIDE